MITNFMKLWFWQTLNRLKAMVFVNTRCCQPGYCLENAPEDYFNPDRCKDCDKC